MNLIKSSWTMRFAGAFGLLSVLAAVLPLVSPQTFPGLDPSWYGVIGIVNAATMALLRLRTENKHDAELQNVTAEGEAQLTPLAPAPKS